MRSLKKKIARVKEWERMREIGKDLSADQVGFLIVCCTNFEERPSFLVGVHIAVVLLHYRRALLALFAPKYYFSSRQ